DTPALKKLRSPEHRMFPAQPNQFFGKAEELLLFLIAIPVEPADLVVLTIGVVIPCLSPPKFITAQDHRRALRHEQRSQKIPALPSPQRIDLRVVGRPFRAAVPRLIVIVAVLAVLPVRFVVLLVIANEVSQSEPVM